MGINQLLTAYDSIVSYLRQWRVRYTDPKQIRRASSRPVSRSTNVHDAPTAVVTIESSKRLRNKHGYWPEQKVSLGLANALDAAGINYDIQWGFKDPVDVPSKWDGDAYAGDWSKGEGTIYWWADEEKRVDADASLLLVDDDGGVTLGTSSIGGAADIDRDVEVQQSVPAADGGALFACLHEVGHALGVGGDADTTTKQTETYGYAWVENGNWHQGLMISTDNGGKNACGTDIPSNHEKARPVVYHNRYFDCATKQIRNTLSQ